MVVSKLYALRVVVTLHAAMCLHVFNLRNRTCMFDVLESVVKRAGQASSSACGSLFTTAPASTRCSSVTTSPLLSTLTCTRGAGTLFSGFMR
jgi:hypothetical protein